MPIKVLDVEHNKDIQYLGGLERSSGVTLKPIALDMDISQRADDVLNLENNSLKTEPTTGN